MKGSGDSCAGPSCATADGRVTAPLAVSASGLRNWMGLAVHSSGAIVQAENSHDWIHQADPKLSDDELPHDELNVLVRGGNYGSPYCFNDERNTPKTPKFVCRTKSTPPAVLLPAHSAPLGMTYWKRPGKPEVLVVAITVIATPASPREFPLMPTACREANRPNWSDGPV